MKTHIVEIQKPETVNFILAQSHFIKTVEDVYEALVESAPGIQFGIAFCEASGPRMIRTEGTDKKMIILASENAKTVGAGHSVFIFLRNVFPINVLNKLKMISEIVHIYCATANPTQVIVAETKQGRGILGVIDGESSFGVEDDKSKQVRKEFLRKIGYKL